jgi:4-hydroxybenzoate polyprenyltransferase
MAKFIQILKDINELIVFKHSVFALPFIFVAMIVASKSANGSVWFGFELLILGLFCAVSARNFAMVVFPQPGLPHNKMSLFIIYLLFVLVC